MDKIIDLILTLSLHTLDNICIVCFIMSSVQVLLKVFYQKSFDDFVLYDVSGRLFVLKSDHYHFGIWWTPYMLSGFSVNLLLYTQTKRCIYMVFAISQNG